MKTFILGLILGILASDGANLYGRYRFEKWSSTHRSTQGMPIEGALKLADYLRNPVTNFLSEFYE